MNIQTLLSALNLGEDKDWEYKSAKGGLPSSLWESYCAMANTDGGFIVLGVKELDSGGFEAQGLDDPQKTERDFWNTVNNRGKVSANLLTNSNVRVESVDGKSVLIIEVPRASRRQRPVFVGQNPLDGTFRRFNEGDYKCSPEEVGRMLADQSEQTADSRILPKFTVDDLDAESVRQYRNRFSARNPNHPWLNEDVAGFLKKLGAWGRDRDSETDGLTVAGLLMFGNEDALSDVSASINFHLDYRERISDAIGDRWADRLTIDGTWVPNLLQFFQRVYPKLVDGLKLPFSYQSRQETQTLFSDPIRSGMSPTHEAIQEALVNALIHADYRGQGGIVIDRFPDRLELSNPGTLLVSLEQMRQGAVSECRNPALQRMFQMMGAGDKAGSGIDKIRQGWASQKWRWPLIDEQLKPDRVRLIMPMVSLLPEDSLANLRTVLGGEFGRLNAAQVQALVTADVEGSVTNQRLQQFSNDHTTDITKMLQELIVKGLLVKDGYGRWASYRLAERFYSSPHKADSSPHKPDSSPHSDDSSPHNDRHSDENGLEIDPELGSQDLITIAEPSRRNLRLPPEQTEQIIIELCRERFLTHRQIADLLQRDAKRTKERFLSKMVQDGRLKTKYAELTHPDQAYTSVKPAE